MKFCNVRFLKPTTECAKSVLQRPGQSLRSGDGLVEDRLIHWRILSAAYTHVPSSFLSWKTVTSIRQSDHWPTDASFCMHRVMTSV